MAPRFGFGDAAGHDSSPVFSHRLGWACRWGRVALVELLLARGADPIEAGAEPWATPLAWAEKRRDTGIAAILRQHGAGR